MNKDNSRPQKPAGTLKERLERLQREFPPEDFKILLDFEKNFTLDEAKEAVVDCLERVEAYIKNGCSTEGLWFQWKAVKKYGGSGSSAEVLEELS